MAYLEIFILVSTDFCVWVCLAFNFFVSLCDIEDGFDAVPLGAFNDYLFICLFVSYQFVRHKSAFHAKFKFIRFQFCITIHVTERKQHTSSLGKIRVKKVRS